MSLLSIVNLAQDKLRLPRSTSVISSTDPNVRNLLALAQEEGDEISTDYRWQELVREHTFTAVAAELQPDGLASDFERIVPETFFNRSIMRQVIGPLTVQEWQVQKSLVSSSVLDAWRIRGGQMLITPVPDAGDTYVYEYETKHWCESASGDPQDAWVADTDMARIPEHLFVLGIEWRWRRDRGLDWQPRYAAYQMAVLKVAAASGGRRVINMAGGRTMDRGVIVPDGSWAL